MNFSIKDTVALQDILMSVYCQNETDKEVIELLCFARNVAEKVAEYFKSTHNKVEFYRCILADKSLVGTMGYECLKKHYYYLMED